MNMDGDTVQEDECEGADGQVLRGREGEVLMHCVHVCAHAHTPIHQCMCVCVGEGSEIIA